MDKDKELKRLRDIDDPVERGKEAARTIALAREIISGAATVRQGAVFQMRNSHMHPSEIAGKIGVSRQRVEQILKPRERDRIRPEII